ncbi:MAG: flagellar biosynthetic protein FliO [Gammaproteobacteria bacterium]|nr:flagellar biosynthetic protein FliO [Gammaproteobacteria bacterium]
MEGKNTQRWNRFEMVLMVAGLLSPAIATATEPVLPAGSSSQVVSLVEVMLKLGLVLALILAAGWLVRRLQNGKRGTSKTLEILDVLPVGPKDRILLVRAGNTQLLVGSTPGRLTALHEMQQPISFAEHARKQLEEQAA